MSLFNSYVKAVWVKLNGTTGLVGLVKEILDDKTAFPKIWLEDGGAADWSNKDDSGLEAVITLHIGSRVEGTKEIRGLMDKCHAALHNQDLTLDGGQSVRKLFHIDVLFNYFFDQRLKLRRVLWKVIFFFDHFFNIFIFRFYFCG